MWRSAKLVILMYRMLYFECFRSKWNNSSSNSSGTGSRPNPKEWIWKIRAVSLE